jgi:hypothetical protein
VPQDVGAVLARNLLWRGDVAPRLRHFVLAFLVEDKAVREHHVVGRDAACPAAFDQRGMEPAAVLVGAFEIHHGVVAAVLLTADAGEGGKVLRVFQHEGVGRAGIEPDIDDVVTSPRARSLARQADPRAPGAYHASAPSLKAAAMRVLTRSSCRMPTLPSPFSRANTAIGTPCVRWREITQSGLI